MMKFIIAACVFLSSVVLLNGEPRIVGGTLPLPGQIPYQVSIQLIKPLNFHFCGGSLVDFRHVVTAAYCVKKKIASEITVWAGGFRQSYGGQRENVSKITIHPDFGKLEGTFLKFDSDIAILELANAFKETPDVRPILLADTETPDNAKCDVSGWGSTISGITADVVEDLLFAQIYIINHNICNRKYNNAITENMICAADFNKDVCYGDAGGPLTYNNKLIGIASFDTFDRDCAEPDFPGVYTNVIKFTKWIKQNSLATINSVQNIQIVAMFIASTLYSLFYR